MNKLIKQLGVSLAGLFLATLTALATDYTWTGGGDGVTWESPANWGKSAEGAYPKSSSDKAIFAANTTASVKIADDLTLSALNLKASTTVTLAAAGAEVVSVTLTSSFEWGNASMNLTLDSIALTRASDCTLGALSSITLKNGADVYLGSLTAANNNTLSLSDQSRLRVKDFKIKDGTAVTIDDSTLMAYGNSYLGSASPGGGRIAFKGANPMLQCYGGNFRADPNSTAYATPFDLDFDIPLGGYKAPPIQAVDSTAFASKLTYRFNVLATSPALLAGTRLDQPVMNAKGITSAYVAAATDGLVALSYTKFDGSEATKDADCNILHLTLNPSSEVDQPKAVCDRAALLDYVGTSVNRREIKLAFEVGACATDGTTTRVTAEGGLTDDPLAFTDGSYTAVTTPKKYNNLVSWSAPKLTFQTCYLRLRIDQLNAQGEVVATSYSRIYSATTVDSATYTWQAVEGNWDGELDDRAHWACSVSDPDDRYDYPMLNESVVAFPADCKATITVPQSMTLGTIRLKGNGADVTIVSADGDKGIVLSPYVIENETRTAEAKITFENLTLNFPNKETNPGAYNTVVFRNCDVTFNTSVNARYNHTRMILENSTALTTGSLRVGGADSCLLISNSVFTSNGSVMLGDTTAGGTIRFEGENPVLACAGGDLRPNMNNNATTLEFLVPAGGYRELPIQTVASPGSFCLRKNGKSGVSYTIRVLPESPILKDFFTGVIPLIDWGSKGFEGTVKDTVTYDVGGVAGAKYQFSPTSAAAGGAYAWGDQLIDGDGNTKALGVKIVGIPDNHDQVRVTAVPAEVGAPEPGFGVVTDGISAGAQKTFTYSPFDAGDGIVHFATAWTVRTFDPAKEEYVQTATGDGGTCNYTHPDPSYPSILTWNLSEGYSVQAVARGKGTVSPTSALVSRGDTVTLTATAGEGATFVAWYDEDGAVVSTELSLAVKPDRPRAFMALFQEKGKVPFVPEIPDHSSLISTALSGVEDGGKVQLEAGVYRLGGPITVNRGMTLEGAADGGTVLKATYNRKDNNVSPVTVSGGATVRRVAITGGFVSNIFTAHGVGMTITSGTLTDCAVTNNVYKGSGNSNAVGVYVKCDAGEAVTITHCTIADNYSVLAVGQTVPDGSGIYVDNSGAVLVDNCLIANNSGYTTSTVPTKGAGAGVYITGGGATTVANCTITGNSTVYKGGGLYLNGNIKPRILNCIIAGNEAKSDTCVNAPDVSASSLAADGSITASVLTYCSNNLVSASAAVFGHDGLAGDPLFKNGCHLKQGSPAIGKGLEIAGVTDVPDLDGVARGESIDLGCYAFVPSTDFEINVSVVAQAVFDDQEFDVSVDYVNPPAGVTIENRYFITDGETEHEVAMTGGRVVADLPGTWRVKVQAVADGKVLAEDVSAASVKVGVRKVYVTAKAEGEAVYPYATEETAAKSLCDIVDLCIDGTEVALDEGVHTFRETCFFTVGVKIRGAGVGKTFFDGKDTDLQMLNVSHPGFLLEGVTFINLYVTDTQGVFIGNMGGTVRNCHFASVGPTHHGMNATGVCISMNGDDALVESCRFENLARDDGEGKMNLTQGLAVLANKGTLRNCLFAKSTVVSGARGANNTACLVWAAAPAVVENCTFVGNTLKGYKPGEGQPGAWATQLYAANGATIRNVLVGAPKIELGEGADDSLLYTVRFDNDKKNVSNCCVEGEETYGANPADGTKICFSETELGHIKVKSSCRNAGANQAWMETAKDLDGNPRRFGRRVDIGCFELQDGPGLVIILK